MEIIVRSARIDQTIMPLLITNGAITRRLRRSKNHVTQSLLDQYIERRFVNCCFRQPHRLRLAPETILKVCDSPNNLRQAIPMVGQRQYRMSVLLRSSVTIARYRASALLVGSNYA